MLTRVDMPTFTLYCNYIIYLLSQSNSDEATDVVADGSVLGGR